MSRRSPRNPCSSMTTPWPGLPCDSQPLISAPEPLAKVTFEASRSGGGRPISRLAGSIRSPPAIQVATITTMAITATPTTTRISNSFIRGAGFSDAAGRTTLLVLRAYLGLTVVLDADAGDEIELSFQVVDVLFLRLE